MSTIVKDYPKDQWRELVTLDYVLTWNYTDNYEHDFKRYRQLSDKWWEMYENQNNKP